MKDRSPEERRLYGSVDAAFAGQNVYLYCASEGLATVKPIASTGEGLRPATQARLLLRWIMIGILVALVAVLYYFLVAAPAGT